MLTSGLVRHFLFVGYLLKPKLLVMDVIIKQIRKVLFKIMAKRGHNSVSAQALGTSWRF